MTPYPLSQSSHAPQEAEGRNLRLLTEAIARIIGASPTMFTRVNFGSRYIGAHWNMLFAAVFRSGGPGMLAVIFLVGMLTQARNAAPLILFLLVAFALSIVHRFIGWLRRSTGLMRYRHHHARHSYYPGTPWLAVILRSGPRGEYWLRLLAEPVLIGVAGLLSSAFFNQALGMYLCVSAFCLFFIGLKDRNEGQNDDMDQEDGMIEAEAESARLLNQSRRTPSAPFVAERLTPQKKRR